MPINATGSRICLRCRRLLQVTPTRAFVPYSPIRYQSSASIASRARHDRPFRMAVIGSGPAGFYTAYRVMTKIHGAKVDMFEALPVPFGLVRFGVAPDHPEVKNCQAKFEEIASSPDFTFIGNVSIGSASTHPGGANIELSSIMRHYDAVVFAYGASLDKTLGIPGESFLEGIYSARQFVAWYNGLPEHAALAPDLTRGEDAVIIGQGNVALDVARMLLESVDELRRTDIAEHALAELTRSRIKRVHVVGRRGPMQAAFTIKEVRELMKLPNVQFHPVDTSLIPPGVASLERARRRLMEVLLKGSGQKSLTSSPKSWSLDFCLSPAEFRGSSDSPHRVAATVFERTELSDPFDPKAQTNGTEEKFELASPIVFRSIGYKSAALGGFEAAGIPFDDGRGIIHNDGIGRVLRDVRAAGAAIVREPFPGLYCAGWVKRGPTGVIASTMADAFATADAITQDWASQLPFLGGVLADSSRDGWHGVAKESNLTTAKVVRWDDWLRIDEAEKERGRIRGKEREKFTSTSDMLGVLG